MANRHIKIFDTTLRDGEQAPGCSMTLREKLRIAKALADLNVDVIEAGFPAASPGDFDAVKAIADENSGPIICGLARCNPDDIEKVHAAVKGADNHRIHVFVATSAIHRQYKLKMAKEEIIKSAVGAIRMARELCEDVEFSPEDASRTELGYLAEVVSAAIEAGATTVNIPDTVGYTVPAEFDNLFRYLNEHVTGIEDITLSVHCHNDLGMAVSNSLAAVHAGARQIECTINGIGERAGNCSLEEVVMALKTRNEFFDLDTQIDTTRLYPTARLVSGITGMQIPRNKAIVGENAFAHEAGIHQHGMLQHGFDLDDFEVNRAFQEFKKLADKKKDMYDGDIEAIIMNVDNSSAGPWTLKSLQITSGTDMDATAMLNLLDEGGDEKKLAATADGPVEAAFIALEQCTDINLTLKNFELHSATVGEDAQGEATVTVEFNGQSYRGHGASQDIVEAAARAYLEVINRILRRRERGMDDAPLDSDINRASI